MNAERMQPTGASPAQIIFGNSINLDNGILLSAKKIPPRQENDRRLSTWMDKMLKIQDSIIQAAQEHQSKEHDTYFNNFPTTRSEFPVNSYVLVNYGDQQKPSKLHTEWRGPYRVVGKDEDDLNRYTVQNLVTNKLSDFHIKNLKTYQFDEGRTQPEAAALRDAALIIVEKIISHSGNEWDPSSLRFEVKWQGLSNSENTLERYADLKTNEILHTYLETLGGSWEALIPIEYTNEGEHYTERISSRNTEPTTTPSIKNQKGARSNKKPISEPNALSLQKRDGTKNSKNLTQTSHKSLRKKGGNVARRG